MVWYFNLLKNFPQFVVIHTVKDFGVINKTKVDFFFLEFFFFCFFYDSTDIGNLISGSSVFSKLEHLEVLSSHTVEGLLGEF